MERHKEILEKTCRLCGRTCSKRSVTKATMKEPLLHIFNIRIENDSTELHGALICETHQRLLRKHAASARKGQVMTVTFAPYKFKYHDDIKCDVCEVVQPVRQTLTGKDLSELSLLKTVLDSADDFLKLFEQLPSTQRDRFLQRLPGACSEEERILLAKSLGQSESKDIYLDSCAIAAQQASSSTYLNYDMDTWLQNRNAVVKGFLIGVAGGDIKERVSFTRAIEQIYYLKNQRLITPLAFFNAFLVYTKTGSREALAASSSSTPASSYKFHQKFINDLPLPPKRFPHNDIVVVFDNEQVYRGRRGIQTKAISSVITNVAYVELDDTLQFQHDLMPRNWFNVSNVAKMQNSNEDDMSDFKKGIDNILNSQSEEYQKLEAIHYHTLALFLQKAIDDVMHEHKKNDYDLVDQFLEQEHTKANSIECPSCGSQNPKSCRNCQHCGEKGAITLARQQQSSTQKPSEKKIKSNFQFKMTDSLTGDSEIEKKDARFSYVPTNENTKKRELVIDEPVLANPASKSNIMCVLRHVGKKSGIALYDEAAVDPGKSKREWVTIVVDGLIYLIIKALKEEVVICSHPHCLGKNQLSSFMSVKDLQDHFKTVHPLEKKLLYSREFDWVLLKVADGHYELTVLKAFFDVNWLPFLQDSIKKLDFVSENQQNYVKSCKDHHLTWEIFVIVFKSGLQELVVPYVRDSLLHGECPTAKNFIENWKAQKKSPAFQFMYQQICMYGQAIFNLRAGVRKNNQEYVLSAKHVLKELLWARNHPKYQSLELYDAVVNEFLDPLVKEQMKDNYSLVTSKSECGEGFDYRLEEANKFVKSLLPSCAPTDEHWYSTCSSAQTLRKIQLHGRRNLGLKEMDGTIRFLRTEAFLPGILKVRAMLRQSEFISQLTFQSTQGFSLHPGLINMPEQALLKRSHVIQTEILGGDSSENESLSHPVYITVEEEEKYTAIENQTNAIIQNRILSLIQSIPDLAVAKLFEMQYQTEIKRKKKEKLLKMYYTLEDVVNNYEEPADDSMPATMSMPSII